MAIDGEETDFELSDLQSRIGVAVQFVIAAMREKQVLCLAPTLTRLLASIFQIQVRLRFRKRTVHERIGSRRSQTQIFASRSRWQLHFYQIFNRRCIRDRFRHSDSTGRHAVPSMACSMCRSHIPSSIFSSATKAFHAFRF